MEADLLPTEHHLRQPESQDTCYFALFIQSNLKTFDQRIFILSEKEANFDNRDTVAWRG